MPVCPARWRPAPAGCREGSAAAGGDSEGEPAAGAGCGPSGPERWRCLEEEEEQKKKTTGVNESSHPLRRLDVSADRALTDQTEARLGQVRPLKDGVEDVLSFAVQLVHLIQDEEPETDRKTESESGFIIVQPGKETTNMRIHSHSGTRGRQEPLQAALPAGRSQLTGQQREDGVGAPQAHTVHHHGLDRRKLSLTGQRDELMTLYLLQRAKSQLSGSTNYY